ncbi:OLC1v1006390C1 [Oldenlandia corymbosa var. corymbosa]|uniref:OLC1v1006390C1 n=1 Tax=Oldenlandia corymbosa var. corymbosa TaxID=529605 RepID=A0AAV1DGY5_OLDCO|nr:OLC1v1006390C1 [Oldenlandia corymbosa var. corymbosa]
MGSSSTVQSVPDEYDEYVKAGSFQIPFDLFVSKKHQKIIGGRSWIDFKDSSGNLVFTVERRHKNRSTTSSLSNPPTKLLLDASGNILFSIQKPKDAMWQCFMVKDNKEELIFRVEKKLNNQTRTEFEIFFMGKKLEEMTENFRMIGSPFERSCTIYNGDSLVAETSLMYKLGIMKKFVLRNRFRVTIFPGFCDVGLIVAMVVIFFDGRKLWI